MSNPGKRRVIKKSTCLRCGTASRKLVVHPVVLEALALQAGQITPGLRMCSLGCIVRAAINSGCVQLRLAGNSSVPAAVVAGCASLPWQVLCGGYVVAQCRFRGHYLVFAAMFAGLRDGQFSGGGVVHSHKRKETNK